jgi:hypothetical protein
MALILFSPPLPPQAVVAAGQVVQT